MSHRSIPDLWFAAQRGSLEVLGAPAPHISAVSEPGPTGTSAQGILEFHKGVISRSSVVGGETQGWRRLTQRVDSAEVEYRSRCTMSASSTTESGFRSSGVRIT